MWTAVRPEPDMITVLTIPTLLISIPSAARGVKSVGVECEDDWINENAVGLGCLFLCQSPSIS